ncbi:MAG: hypothetical protein A4E49_02873 [Methanosaeta sp. PtaU1.Bin112]|nr:MAG: hypothetical protein A4E49_02873 [Methanosaeta sp. PtaU1.Bin112]
MEDGAVAQEFQDTAFDLAATVCNWAKQACPVFSTNLQNLGKSASKSPRAREAIQNSLVDPTAPQDRRKNILALFEGLETR